MKTVIKDGSKADLIAVARIAWESAQEHAAQLDEIERLLVAGKDAQAVTAMKHFFQMEKRSSVE
jgi:hypothetical protein